MAKEESTVQPWLTQIASYDKAFKKWESRVEKLIKRYKDENRESNRDQYSRFNILWANVQTLKPATFARLPKPEVARRFKDNDPVGRVASMILERCLDYEIEHYPDYRDTLDRAITDRFLGGRGTAWVRYEPKFKTGVSVLEDGSQVTEDVENEGIEETETLDYECAKTDYVHWRDFGHSIARTWEEVTAVWRRVYMGREALVERFGEELGNKIPVDTRPDDGKNKIGQPDQESELKAAIYEIWDKENNRVLWISKSWPEVLDERTPGAADDDPPEFEGFWPCPKPIYATLTNESLVPVPDFTLYQDQAKTLDTLSDRIRGLVEALAVRGVYDASYPTLARIFTESGNGDLIPVKDYAGFSEKGGVAGAISLVDLKPIAEALRESYGAFDQVKNQVYEITGISDIIRGQTAASETATAQQIKGQYASLRLKSYQQEVAMFATELLRLKAQIICARFEPQTIVAISAAEQLSPDDQKLIPQAVMLLKDKPLRNFRIDVAADSLVMMDEQEEKQSRMEFLTALGGFIEKAAPVVAQSPDIAPLVMEMMKFGVGAFKAGKQLEGAVDSAAEQIKQKAAQPKQPPPDPEMMKVQAEAQARQQEMQFTAQQKQAEMQMDQQREAAKLQAEQALEQLRMRAEAERDARQAQLDQHKAELQAQVDQQRNAAESAREQMRIEKDFAFQQWKAELDARTKIEIAEIQAQTTLQSSQAQAATEAAKGQEVKNRDDVLAKAVNSMSEAVKTIGKPKKIVRDGEGKVAGIE